MKSLLTTNKYLNEIKYVDWEYFWVLKYLISWIVVILFIYFILFIYL
jgi:hypothetical protein